MKKVRVISLIALIITSCVSLDLLVNYLWNLNPQMHDGLSLNTVILWGKLYFGDSLWSMERFFDAFVISSSVFLMVLVENIILTIIDVLKK